MPGDYGFDPLRLGVNSSALPYYQEAERMNGRWAMLGLVGILAADFTGVDFYTAGADAGTGSFDLQTLIIVEAAFFAVVESLRYNQVRPGAPPAGSERSPSRGGPRHRRGRRPRCDRDGAPGAARGRGRWTGGWVGGSAGPPSHARGLGGAWLPRATGAPRPSPPLTPAPHPRHLPPPCPLRSGSPRAATTRPSTRRG